MQHNPKQSQQDFPVKDHPPVSIDQLMNNSTTSTSSKGQRVVQAGGDKMTITPLGAGNEVGRSAILVTFKGKSVLFDCGIHPAHSGMESLPYFDEIDPSTVDLVLVSHFHLDHCGAVPYFLEKTEFRGKMYMTHPTKAIYKLLLSDFVKVGGVPSEEMLFNEQDLIKSLDKIELIDYHQELEHKGIKFWCYNAGHVLGAAMFMIEIAGVKILYTGDFSRQSDRHLLGAETPVISPDVLIVESTYGIQIHEPRREREIRFTKMVHDVVKRGGRCLIPVFALGRAQELLLILDEYWEAHPELQHIPIYYASSLAKKCMKIFQTYINMMNDKIRKQFDISNPFIFKHIDNLKSIQDFEDVGPSVVMASPGMLQSGVSYELFQQWCSDPKNGVIIPGYCVDGTLAKRILSEPSEITLSDGATVPLKLTVQAISFSAHSDRQQTEEFISSIRPPHIVLVHGDPTNCSRLKQALISKFSPPNEKQTKQSSTSATASSTAVQPIPNFHVYTPKNCEAVEIVFHGIKIAKVLGDLANKKPSPANFPEFVSGVLLHKDFQRHLVAPSDLRTFADVLCTSIKQKLLIPIPKVVVKGEEEASPLTIAKYWKEKITQIFQNIEIEDSKTSATINIAKQIKMTIYAEKTNEASFEWNTNFTSDIIVDAIITMILSEKKDKIILMDEVLKEDIRSSAQILYSIQQILSEQFNTVTVDVNKNEIHLELEKLPTPDSQDNLSQTTTSADISNNPDVKKKVRVVISSAAQLISCDDENIKSRLEITLRRIYLSLFPMPSLLGCLEECDHGGLGHFDHLKKEEMEE